MNQVSLTRIVEADRDYDNGRGFQSLFLAISPL